jgi:hypothetical protein
MQLSRIKGSWEPSYRPVQLSQTCGVKTISKENKVGAACGDSSPGLFGKPRLIGETGCILYCMSCVGEVDLSLSDLLSTESG